MFNWLYSWLGFLTVNLVDGKKYTATGHKVRIVRRTLTGISWYGDNGGSTPPSPPSLYVTQHRVTVSIPHKRMHNLCKFMLMNTNQVSTGAITTHQCSKAITERTFYLFLIINYANVQQKWTPDTKCKESTQVNVNLGLRHFTDTADFQRTNKHDKPNQSITQTR